MKKLIALMLSLAMLLALLAGCGAAPKTGDGTNETEPESATRIIVDEAGNEVEIPREINRVAITSVTPLPALFALFMGSAEKLVGIHPASKNTAMHSIVAELVPDIAFLLEWKKPTLERRDVLLVLRHDKEKTLSEEERLAMGYRTASDGQIV